MSKISTRVELEAGQTRLVVKLSDYSWEKVESLREGVAEVRTFSFSIF